MRRADSTRGHQRLRLLLGRYANGSPCAMVFGFRSVAVAAPASKVGASPEGTVAQSLLLGCFAPTMSRMSVHDPPLHCDHSKTA
jgi:hypothetical protein